MLNVRGVDLFWPAPVRLVTPGNRNWRLDSGIPAGMTVDGDHSHFRTTRKIIIPE
jgi:hypothetical protein